jgi:hypothetical protein
MGFLTTGFGRSRSFNGLLTTGFLVAVTFSWWAWSHLQSFDHGLLGRSRHIYTYHTQNAWVQYVRRDGRTKYNFW